MIVFIAGMILGGFIVGIGCWLYFSQKPKQKKSHNLNEVALDENFEKRIEDAISTLETKLSEKINSKSNFVHTKPEVPNDTDQEI